MESAKGPGPTPEKGAGRGRLGLWLPPLTTGIEERREAPPQGEAGELRPECTALGGGARSM